VGGFGNLDQHGNCSSHPVSRGPTSYHAQVAASEASFDRLLAFDCSGAACSAAVWRDGAVRSQVFVEMERGQAEHILPQIARVMDEARLSFDELEAIATIVGPGSFTGLRIGLAAARGVALASGKKLIALDAFEAFLAAIPIDCATGLPILVAVDSRRGPVFAQLFGPDRQKIGEPAQVERDALLAFVPDGPVAIAGDGQAAFAALNQARFMMLTDHFRIRAAAVARAAALLGPDGLDRLPLSPLYLRPPDVTMPKQRPL